MRISSFTLTVLIAFGLQYGFGQQTNASHIPNLEWRNVGPKRGGRCIAVAGHQDRPFEFYFGATGGGLWKTEDAGNSWRPVTDGQIHSASVGSVAVAPSNPDIVYLGMGETQLRSNVLQGDGVYRSTDGGKSWSHLGLKETQSISRIRIHPTNPDIVYVAALGHPFGPNPERGIFKTTNGGQTWTKILYRDEHTGAIEICLDPKNPDILLASFWQVYRKPWILSSGGAGSGIFKSTNGGKTWQEITQNKGLPKGILGKIGLAISEVDSNRIYANIEAENGGLYRSDDGSKTWQLINNHRDLWQRAFYFMRMITDPIDKETVYVMNFRIMKSTDGGKTFEQLPDAHADHHDLWINPKNNKIMIDASDGGGVVSLNGGNTWSSMSYPTAQIYRLTVTNDYPYHLCGAQQDNSTICVASDGGFLRNPRVESGLWMYAVGGGENGYVATHPTKNNIFYAGATNTLTRYDRNTGMSTDIQPYPRIVMGEPARDMPERWNWNYPIVTTKIDPNAIYVGSQHLWKSADEGNTWKKISGDLTKAVAETLGDSGGPIIKDQDGPEIYGTIYAIAPSKQEQQTIWTGSDDGLVYLTRDGGTSWRNVTPPEAPENTRIGLIETSYHKSGTAYVTGRRYEMDDRTPYIWKTTDFGNTWRTIVNGIPMGHFVYSICEDPIKPGILYAGTEHGVQFSTDSGTNWSDLSLNLPSTPVMGIKVKNNDLVIATHGRSFWILDNIGMLREFDATKNKGTFRLFQPTEAVRRSRYAIFDFHLPEQSDKIKLVVKNAASKTVRVIYEGSLKSGYHRYTWNLRYPGATIFPNIILEGGNPRKGPWAPPGEYVVSLEVDGKQQEKTFELKKDPRLIAITDHDLVKQFELALKIRDAEDEANKSILKIRDLKGQLNHFLQKTKSKELGKKTNKIIQSLGEVEKKIYQVKNQSPKDKIAFPIKLNDRLTGLRSRLEEGDGAPTRAYYEIYEQLSKQLTVQLEKLNQLMKENRKYLQKIIKTK